jgi:S1-C subfamily serine protease
LSILPLTSGAAQDLDAAGARVARRVVLLRASRGPSLISTGTGFLVGRGYVLTAGHVVRDSTAVSAWLEGERSPRAASVIDEDPARDMALLRLAGDDSLPRPLAIGASGELASGDSLLIVSRRSHQPAPPGERREEALLIPAEFAGWGTRRAPSREPVQRLVLRARVDRGDSGSPVVRLRDGAAVGILTQRQVAEAGEESEIAYAMPVDAAGSLLARAGAAVDRLVENRPARRPELPAPVRPVNPRSGDYYLRAFPPAPASTRRDPPPASSPGPAPRRGEFYLVPLARQARPGP